jgi:hypothetical protein
MFSKIKPTYPDLNIIDVDTTADTVHEGRHLLLRAGCMSTSRPINSMVSKREWKSVLMAYIVLQRLRPVSIVNEKGCRNIYTSL